MLPVTKGAMPRGDLFPDISPYETGLLPLSPSGAAADGVNHVMYWEQVGNPRGQPVLFLHGGPGAGAAWKTVATSCDAATAVD